MLIDPLAIPLRSLISLRRPGQHNAHVALGRSDLWAKVSLQRSDGTSFQEEKNRQLPGCLKRSVRLSFDGKWVAYLLGGSVESGAHDSEPCGGAGTSWPGLMIVTEPEGVEGKCTHATNNQTLKPNKPANQPNKQPTYQTNKRTSKPGNTP